MRKTLLSLVAVLVFILSAAAQDHVITGRVVNDKNQPVEGVSVTAANNKYGTQTAKDGTYSLKLPLSVKTLNFSSVDFTAITKTITGNSVNVSLSAVNRSLDEVVVVGYQTIRKRDLTAAVGNVGAKDIEDKPIPSLLQNLQGKVPGVQVTGQSGRPGANAFIRIRGTGSINASSEPLIIYDGIAITTAAYALLNPDDIGDISILKDASGTAIYGSRGSNGVILVSSKKGKGTPTISYSFQYGQSKFLPLNNVQLMNGPQKLQYEYEYNSLIPGVANAQGNFKGNYVNPILDTMITNRISAGTLPVGATILSITAAQRQALWDLVNSRSVGDWNNVFLRTATLKSHNIAISGAKDKFSYYFSLNKSDYDGIEQNSYLNKIGTRLNIEYQVNDFFKLGTNIGVTHSVENINRELNNSQALYTGAQTLNPWEPFYGSDGKYNYTTGGQNPLETSLNNPSVSNRISSFATIFGDVKLYKDLTFRSQLSSGYNTLSTEYYVQPGSYLAATLGYNQKRDNGNWDFLYTWANTLNYNHSIKGKHNINFLVGTEYTKDKVYSYSLTARAFPSASVTTLENGATKSDATTSRSDWSLISYFANAQYNYDRRYYVNVSGRRDGSSRFGKGNQFANFYSVGGAWSITDEKFFKVKAITNLKLRASYGTTGNNTGIGNYAALGTYSLNVGYNGQGAATPGQIQNTFLTWEEKTKRNIGLDLGFLHNRINGSIDLYNDKSDKLLYPVNLSQTTGFASYTGNVGSLRNKGIELALNADVVKTKDLTVNLFVNYAHNDNKILSLYNDSVAGIGTSGYAYLKVGEPIYTYFLANWAGVNPTTGKNEWFDQAGVKHDVWNASYQKLQRGKSPNVKYSGSFGANLSFKGFDLSAQFYYSGGNYIYNIVWDIASSEGESIKRNQYTDVSDYWKKPGDVKRYGNLADITQRSTYDSDKYLEKGDYISLRDLTLGYSISSTVLNRLKIKGARFYIQGTNLWLGTKFHGNPEVGQSNSEQTALTTPGLSTLYSYPQTRSVTCGLNIKF